MIAINKDLTSLNGDINQKELRVSLSNIENDLTMIPK